MILGGDDAEVFRNRKGYFSINAQVVGDSQLKIQDIVARWPGSAHDLTVFNNSRIRARFEGQEFQDSVLLGDSGYANRNYLLVPLLNPSNRAEELYNEAHIRTRNTIERLFGVAIQARISQ
ncbi:putative nuclease HARBI1 [Anthonomus grandis grandis]|uniref:putative nuclease HARBI1 n=1 Tax=Anthonomus grandis grandis TaxID=2921223 RepID=UPI0021650015|nr:putative nuclease HARBI1 [Anthonomus grandis grandis]